MDRGVSAIYWTYKLFTSKLITCQEIFSLIITIAPFQLDSDEEGVSDSCQRGAFVGEGYRKSRLQCLLRLHAEIQPEPLTQLLS